MKGRIDVKIFRVSVLIIGLLILFGCSNDEEKNAKVNPSFVSEGVSMQGIEGKIGILGLGFVANEPNKHMWHLWGSEEELSGDFKVEAVHLKTGEKINPFISDNPSTLGGPNNGADAHLPSSMILPKKGLWQLDAYLDDALFGSIIVEAK
ncbi:DUF4871 domain-containing protein [Cohnella thailandensis]|uniref:DUF4871 domain-containing protein n=1 Tax=Cohnella thailandensis TaxID=557557 RepID=A0A841T5A7_9BACL|nr:DUF4871 domain-containing protein [Cohnella thailandensis]